MRNSDHNSHLGSRLNQPISIKNVLSLQQSLVQSWRAEPISLLVNLHRRRGTERTSAYIDVLKEKTRNSRFKSVAALTALLAEDYSSVEQLLLDARGMKVSSRQAKLLADIAMTSGHANLAEGFVGSITASDSGARLTKAKLLWHNGEISNAIEQLSGTNARERRLREFYEAEREVFGGWRPELEQLEDYRPLPKVVLHLLTNSLPHTMSGYTQRSHSILLEQSRAGAEVHAVTRLGYPQSIGVHNSHGVDVVDGIKYHRMRLDGARLNLRDHHQQEASELLELVKIIRPSVIHTTTHFVNGAVAGAVARAAGVPWIYEIRGQLSDTWASKRGPEAVKSERYVSFKREELAVAKEADAVITIGREMRNTLVRGDVPQSSISLSPNAVGEQFLVQPRPATEVRSELGLETKPVHIGTVSSLVAYEGLETLIRAFALLRDRGKNARLLIVGDGEAIIRLKRTATELGLNCREIFIGRVSRSDAVKYHQALDVFVVPRDDLLVTRAVTPLKPVEAMAMGRPVVASDLPALREIVSDGVNGKLVPPDNPEALADALEDLVDDESERLKMGRAGREMVLKTRTWERSVQASLKLYQKLSAQKVNAID